MLQAPIRRRKPQRKFLLIFRIRLQREIFMDRRAIRVSRVLKDHKDRLDLAVNRVLKEIPDSKAYRAFRVNKDLAVRRATRVIPVSKDRKA